MMGSFTTSLERESLDWVGYIEIEAFGRRVGAIDAPTRSAYRFSTRHPHDLGYSANDVDKYVDRLLDPASIIKENIDIRTGSTNLGAMSFNIIDGPLRDIGFSDHGWSEYLMTDLLSFFAGSSSAHSSSGGIMTLTTAVTTAPASGTIEIWSVNDSSDFLVGDALWIGKECVIISALPSSSQATVIRGQYGTSTQAHPLTGPLGEGIMYDRPQYIKGRTVKFYVNLIDKVTGDLLDESEEAVVWTGVLDDFQSDRLTSWEISCKPTIGTLDKLICRNQLAGTVSFENLTTDSWQDAWRQEALDTKMASGVPMVIPVEVEDGVGSVTEPDYLAVAGIRKFNARLGNQAVQVSELDGVYTVTDWALAGTKATLDITNESLEFREVLLTNPNTLAGTPIAYFVDDSGDPSSHPIDIMLNFITSTGQAHVSGGTLNGEWDSLPRGWGAGVDDSLVDLAEFRRIKGKTAGMKMSQIIIGWDGEPIQLRTWFEKNILGPLGWFLYQNVDGQISLGTLSEEYPGFSNESILEEDIVDSIVPKISGQTSSTLTYQSWKYDYEYDKEKFRKVARFRHPQVIERLDGIDSDISFEVYGIDKEDAIAEATILNRGNTFSRWFITPRPLLTLAVGIDMLALSITSTVNITCSDIPNMYSGSRGMIEMPGWIVGREIDFDKGIIKLEILLIGEQNVGRWAPSAKVVSWDGPTTTLTVEENEYTGVDSGGLVPDRDVLDFQSGDYVMLVDSDGALRTNDFIDSIVGAIEPGAVQNTLTVPNGFSTGATTYTPVAGDILIYQHYSSSGSLPRATWTTTMKERVAQADETTGDLPNGDAAYVYGT